MQERPRYAAFISYSSHDSAFARRLHRALEGYVIPAALGSFALTRTGRPNRVYPVFRDREELPAGELTEQIQAALRESDALIVICSPSAAASPWVAKELESFRALGRSERIFLIIAEGAPLLTAAGEDATASCFPGSLRDADGGLPLAADARREKDGFRNAWLKIVAGLIGRTPGQLIDRDRQRRRARAIRSGALWGVGLILISALWLNRSWLEPLIVSWLKYQGYVVADDELATRSPGASFQDCQPESSDCPSMVIVPEGEFMMGSPEAMGENDERPTHRVSIPRLAISANEITFAEWQACLAAHGCNGYQPDRNGWEDDQRPVINVSWTDAQAYVAWLSRMTGQEYRLLSEAEWEYAARAGSTGAYHWGDVEPTCEAATPNAASYGGCTQPRTSPVGNFEPNAFGLFDMHGNVWEWVQDCYVSDYSGTPADGSAVEGEACEQRVFRGGSWYVPAPLLRSAIRFRIDPAIRENDLGFRIARTIASD